MSEKAVFLFVIEVKCRHCHKVCLSPPGSQGGVCCTKCNAGFKPEAKDIVRENVLAVKISNCNTFAEVDPADLAKFSLIPAEPLALWSTAE